MAVKTYDSKLVVVTFGPNILTGYADGEFLSVDRSADSWGSVIGAGGELARWRSNDKSAAASLKLLQTSPTNDVLSALQIADELTGAGILPFMVKDLRGTSLLLAQEAWIVRPPKFANAREVGEREWMFFLAEANMLVGGNNP